MQKTVGVKNTNRNVYDEMISVEEFMQRINLDAIEDEKRRVAYEYALDGASDPSCKLEHVDTYLTPDGEWRVQLRLVVEKEDMPEHWNEIDFFMNFFDMRWSKYFLSNPQFHEHRFYGVITFNVPAK